MYKKIKFLILSCLFTITLCSSKPALAKINAPVYTCLKAAFQIRIGYLFLKSAITANNKEMPIGTITDKNGNVTTIKLNVTTKRLVRAVCGYLITKWGVENALLVING